MSELITLIDLLQPQCSRTYGVAPCTASLGTTGAGKCYNTRATCQSPTNYAEVFLTIRMAKSQEGLGQYGYVLPCITSFSITPLSINFGGMDKSMSAFGRRESLSITMSDMQHSDVGVDPYREERLTGAAGTVYDPYNSGSFWGKWLARNQNFEGFRVLVRQGVLGQDAGTMETRTYVLTSVSGPSDGVVQMTAKDLFSMAEGRRSQAPKASRGELKLGFDENHRGTFEIVPAEIADEDYDTDSFYVAIGDELFLVSRGTGSAVFQILDRGYFGSEKQKHDTGDKVQQVLFYNQLQAQAIVYDLLTNYTVVGPSYITLGDWNAEMVSRPEQLTAWIAEPTPVEQLIGELAEQVGFTIWPDVVDNMVRLKVLTPDEVPVHTVDDNYWMLRGSYSSKIQSNQRVSQVWVYYGQKNPAEDLDNPQNYSSRRIFADLESEDFYGSPAIRQVFSRWIPQYAGTFATKCGERILTNFRNPPRRSAFRLHRTRAGSLKLAELFNLVTRDDQTVTGGKTTRVMVPFELYTQEDSVIVQAQEIAYFGSAGDIREIQIDADANNVSMKTLYESLYGPAQPGDSVTIRVLSGVKIGSTSSSAPAMTTGSWPPGVDLQLILNAGAKILGKGGNGGNPAGSINGDSGGNALEVQTIVLVTNNGTIAGGGGGGGGAKDTATIFAQGGGGAGKTVGTGNASGTETTGGAGGSAYGSDPYTYDAWIAIGGAGGDLGMPGEAGSYGGLGSSVNAGEGGAAGYAIVGDGYVLYAVEGTIIGEVSDQIHTEFNPPPVAPTNLTLDAQLSLISSSDYATTMVMDFDKPDDDRIIGYEAQVQSARYPGIWKPLFSSDINHYEWNTSELGVFRVRVRSIYVKNIVYSSWATVSTVNNGNYALMYAIGLADPINPKLFITLNEERTSARIMVEASYDSTDELIPDRLLLMYSVAEHPNKVTCTSDTGSKLYFDAPAVVISQFEMNAASGGSLTQVNFTNNGQFDIDVMGYWWANVIDNGVTPTYFLKVAEATETTLKFAPGDAFPIVAGVGDKIGIVESQFSDSRAAEFKLIAAVDPNNPGSTAVEIIKHNGIQYDGNYFIEPELRGAEGTTQANQTGKELHYFPAPGPLTQTIELPVGGFGSVGNLVNFRGEVQVQIPTTFSWASLTCCFARKASEGSRTKFVRSNIVHLSIAGPA